LIGAAFCIAKLFGPYQPVSKPTVFQPAENI